MLVAACTWDFAREGRNENIFPCYGHFINEGVLGRRLVVGFCETAFGAGKVPIGFSIPWLMAEGKS